MTGFVPVMWAIWCVLVVVMIALHVYRTSLTRDEEDQVFLDDSFEQEKAAQEVIVSKVNKIQPALHLSNWLVGAMSLFIVAYYIRYILLTLRVIG